MIEEKKSEALIAIRTSAVAEFFGTLWGKIISILAVITLLLGIYVEAISAWRGTNEAIIAAANVGITASNAVKAREEAASAHAQSCTAQMSLLFGGGVYPSYLNALPDTPAGRKFVTECGDYLNDGQREQFARKDAADAEEKRRVAKLTPVVTAEEREKRQDDNVLAALGLERTGSEAEDEKLLCIARVALGLMSATDWPSEKALKEIRTPGSKMVEAFKVDIGRHDDKAMKCVIAMTAH